MTYNIALAARIRAYFATQPHLKVEEKKMFQGLTFMIDDKMCVGVSKDNLMCRFSPSLQHEVAERIGYMPMLMKGKEFLGFCYVSEEGFQSNSDFAYWLGLCLAFNPEAKSSKKK
jgi:hypothetical protein